MRIDTNDLVPMDMFTNSFPVRIVLDYACSDNLLFQEQIYHSSARLWLHQELAVIVLLAAKLCHDKHGLCFALHDGLRTKDAQKKMLHTQRVQENPHWLEEPRLLSPPGAGAHPRGMAIDISLQTEEGSFVDMGTPFDYLAERPGPNSNPAHREYLHSKKVKENRTMLDKPMLEAALRFNTSLHLLPQEWWDFRFQKNYYEDFEPLKDSDLPPQMRMIETKQDIDIKENLDSSHFESLKTKITDKVHKNS